MLSDSYNTILGEKLHTSNGIAAELDGKQVFIVGASGFLASNLIAFLDALRRKFSVHLTIRISSRRPFEGLPLWKFIGHVPAVIPQIGDVETTVLSGEQLTVVHAASYGAPPDYMRQPLETFRSNTNGVCALLEQPAVSIRHFVFISSAEAYGQPPQEAIPTSEGYPGSLQTTTPRSIYGESKRMGEVLSVNLCQNKKIPLTILRPWNLYGPGQRDSDSRVPMQLVQQCRRRQMIELESDGSPSRSFCYVLDGVAQIAAAMAKLPEEMSIFNIGNGEAEITVAHLARECLKCCGLPASRLALGSRAGGSDIRRSCPDTRMIAALCPPSTNNHTPLSAGLQSLRDWVDFLAGKI